MPFYYFVTTNLGGTFTSSSSDESVCAQKIDFFMLIKTMHLSQNNSVNLNKFLFITLCYAANLTFNF